VAEFARRSDDDARAESRPAADSAAPYEAAAREGELIEPNALPTTMRPPGRKPVPPLHVIAPLTAEEISILTADPNELLRRRTADYLTFAHNLISASPSRINRVAFAVESQRRMADRLLTLAIPPTRLPADQFGETRASTDQELLAILASLGPDPAQSLSPAPEPETREGLGARGTEEAR